jgi:negative regulator of flagellin synthesis FlgM
MTIISGTDSTALTGNRIDQTERATGAAKPAKPEVAATKANAGATVDAASLSGAGSLLAAAAANTDDVRTDKVEALKAAINNGTYNIPAADVADKLIRNMLG